MRTFAILLVNQEYWEGRKQWAEDMASKATPGARQNSDTKKKGVKTRSEQKRLRGLEKKQSDNNSFPGKASV